MTDLESLLAGPVVAAARGLLGRHIVSDADGERVVVCIGEVEAYGGADDPASHAYRGPTARNRSMFEAAGTLYVYRSYGIHWCANIVCGPAGSPAAVLLRGGSVVEGGDVVRRRRGRDSHLCDGPGRLTQALGVSGGCDGVSVFHSPLRIVGQPVVGRVRATPRVGISRATRRPWRFVLATPSRGPGDNPRA